MADSFTENALDRLRRFLTEHNQNHEIELLTPDASTREYFRIGWQGDTAIACVYGEPFAAAEHSYLDVTKLFLESDLPVAEIYEFDENLGVIVQEDFGDRILRDVLLKADDETRENYLNDAIRLIAKIQAATPKAFELNSIASKLKFDEEKLGWELDFFKTHYFESLKKQQLPAEEARLLTEEFAEIVRELETRATVLCHRDFHAANLMLDRENHLRIIDHQDARLGSAAYDLVSLLLDRVTTAPTPDWLAGKRRFFLAEREKLGLEKLNEDVFADEFRLQTIQRCLKAIGTFSYQSTFRGKTYFLPFIKPMFEIVLRAAENMHRFPNLQRIVKAQISN
jgi:aminoglycoside/choline kinase family phosphotransferase